MTTVIALSDGTRIDLAWEFDEIADALSDVSLETLARGIAKQCRYNGACENFYSVARHSSIGAKALNFNGAMKDTCRGFLLHDLHEAIIGDIASPVQRYFDLNGNRDAMQHLKLKIDMALSRRFKVNMVRIWSEQVEMMDETMFHHEWRHLMPTHPKDEGISSATGYVMPEHLIAQIRGKNHNWRADLLDYLDAAEWLGVS